jgi:capsule polysaccharide export protein KpsE/RkpR
MENTKRFLEHQIASDEQQLRAAEQRRADFRTKYPDILSYTSATEAARNSVRDIDGRLQDAVITRDALRKEPANAPAMPANGATGKADGAVTGKRSVSNPVFDQLKVRLVEADAAVATLQRQRAAAAELLDQLEKVQREQPGLVAEYQNMDRDYSVLRNNYEQLLNRLQSANPVQAADTQADKVKLRIVDPPETPRLPVAPNRLLLVSGVLVAGIGGGIACTILLGQRDRSFSTVDQLRDLGLPVLGGISILGRPPLQQRVLSVARFSAAVVALVGVYGGLMAYILRVSASI